MSRLISQILLSLLSLPAASVFYMVLYVVAQENYPRYFGYSWWSRSIVWLFAGAMTWVVLGIYWFFIWRKGVVWTATRKQFTFWTPFAAIGFATLGYFALSVVLRNDIFAMFIASILAPLTWLIATVYVWRNAIGETRDSTGVVCPNCNYNLTGLTEARCPECGSTFTLDQLFATQPSVVAAKQDREVT